MARRDDDPAAALGCLIGSLVMGLIVIEALVRALSYLLILGAILLTLGAICLAVYVVVKLVTSSGDKAAPAADGAGSSISYLPPRSGNHSSLMAHNTPPIVVVPRGRPARKRRGRRRSTGSLRQRTSRLRQAAINAIVVPKDTRSIIFDRGANGVLQPRRRR